MKKICRVLFSRYFVSAVFILAELFMLLYLVTEAYSYSLYAFILFVILDAAAVIAIVNKSSNPEYKVSWLVVVAFVPFFGAVLYFMFSNQRETKKSARLMKEIEESFEKSGDPLVRVEFDGVFEEIIKKSPLAAGKAYAVMNDDPLAKLYHGTSSRYFASGEEMFEAMTDALRSAEKYIFLEYFIIDEGEMWDEIYKILKEKAAAGVEVRVMYDDIGSMKTLPRRFSQMLTRYGISSVRFAPVTPRITIAHNHRDHRKIMIVDGKKAYTGGINIADEYINRKKRFGYWKDGGIEISGMAVEGFLRLFLSMWDFAKGKVTEKAKYMDSVSEEGKSDGGFYLPFGSGPIPIYRSSVGKNALLNLINQAKSYVYITTPYLIIDYDLTESLCNASRRGVDVRIITPGIADKKTVKVMTKSSYPHLMSAGVRIYEYECGFIHQKNVISDDKYLIVGTINMDYRSLAHHYEDAVWTYNSSALVSAKEDFLLTLDSSDERDDGEARLTFFEWCVRNLVRIFAPLL